MSELNFGPGWREVTRQPKDHFVAEHWIDTEHDVWRTRFWVYEGQDIEAAAEEQPTTSDPTEHRTNTPQGIDRDALVSYLDSAYAGVMSHHQAVADRILALVWPAEDPRLTQIRALCDERERTAIDSPARMFNGDPFPALLGVEEVRAILDAPPVDATPPQGRKVGTEFTPGHSMNVVEGVTPPQGNDRESGEGPLPSLPSEPYTVIRVTWRDPEYLTGSHIYFLASDEYWVPQNRNAPITDRVDLQPRITDFEVLASPKFISGDWEKAVENAKKVRHETAKEIFDQIHECLDEDGLIAENELTVIARNYKDN